MDGRQDGRLLKAIFRNMSAFPNILLHGGILSSAAIMRNRTFRPPEVFTATGQHLTQAQQELSDDPCHTELLLNIPIGGLFLRTARTAPS
jgi:hypothetical protein